MSRLESNAEPSMEEILASIRKIIAEDSPGLRPSSASPRPGAPYSPSPKAATPQPASSPTPTRGFMTREAFLKSTHAEPEQTKDSGGPLGGLHADDNRNSAPSSRMQPREASPAKSAPSMREREATPAARDVPGPAKPESSPKLDTSAPSRPAETRKSESPADIDTDEDDAIETIEFRSVEDALPVVKDEGKPTAATPETKAGAEQKSKSDAESIDAQLTELLSEDLNALRQSRLSGEQKKPAEPSERQATSSESADPFAFDLGPSPFAAKPEPQQERKAPTPAPAKPAVETPAASERPAAAAKPAEPARETRPASAEPNVSPDKGYANGPQFGPFGQPPASAREPVAPSFATQPPSESDAAAAKLREPFGVPSVSATLGPTRKLEPLSNAFRPAPPSPNVMESFAPAPENAPQSSRPASPPRADVPPRTPEFPLPPEPPIARTGHRDEPVLHSGLPATTSDSALDRPMEDAVADLLRPLLKTWLAENMPKIVERALRREMSERLLPNQKNSND